MLTRPVREERFSNKRLENACFSVHFSTMLTQYVASARQPGRVVRSSRLMYQEEVGLHFTPLGFSFCVLVSQLVAFPDLEKINLGFNKNHGFQKAFVGLFKILVFRRSSWLIK